MADLGSTKVYGDLNVTGDATVNSGKVWHGNNTIVDANGFIKKV